LGQGNRELLTGNRKRVLGDFTFLHIPLNFSVHLLILGLIVFNPKMKYLTPEQVYKQFGDHPKTTAE
jgi:hypothetical protein